MLCLSTGLWAEQRASLTPTEAAALKNQDVIFLDVRTTAERFLGHVAGSIHIPHGDVATSISAQVPDKSKAIVAYCRSGGRAQSVIADLKAQGYTAIPVVDGGYAELIDAGLPDG